MREIKFRAWDKLHKDMSLSFGLHEDVVFICKDHGSHSTEYINTDQFEIMQYTGLSDKNGKSIYEGDVLQNTNPVWKKEIVSFVMIWDSAAARFSDYSPREDFEIIGNVYENPEYMHPDFMPGDL